MYDPKEEVFGALKSLGYYTALSGQAVFSETPAITYRVESVVPEYDLDKTISSSDVVITVDLWANNTEEISDMISEVEEVMREINYLNTWSSDIPSPEGSLYHHQLRFGGIK